MSGCNKKITIGLLCSIVAVFFAWLGTTIWTRWKVTLFILSLLGLNGGCHANGSPATNIVAQPTVTTLVTFNETNGSIPSAGLVLAKDGNFYGVTYIGGANKSDNGLGYGTAFKMTPEGKLTTLVNFSGGNGSQPSGNLVQGKDGNFYGTTVQGGEIGGGTVFKMTPDGKVTRLYSFGDYDDRSNENTNGWAPDGLVQGVDGNFYGITDNYGFRGGGTVFRMTPEGKLTTLIAYSGRTIAHPSAPLLIGRDGNLYGTIGGSLFKMTSNGTITTAFSYDGATSVLPVAGLIQGKDGKFFGLTTCGSTGGSILRMNINGKFNTLSKIISTNRNFQCPSGELIEATDGNFYGVTFSGNAHGAPFGFGTIFRLKPDGTLTTVLEFNKQNGHYPNTRLVQGKDGSLYGTTAGGLGINNGIIFRLTLER